MKIDELIKELEQVKKQKGNINAKISYDNIQRDIRGVKLNGDEAIIFDVTGDCNED